MLDCVVAEPTEIEYLASVLETIYVRREIIEQSDREECAREVLSLYANGVTDRRELLRRMLVVG